MKRYVRWWAEHLMIMVLLQIKDGHPRFPLKLTEKHRTLGNQLWSLIKGSSVASSNSDSSGSDIHSSNSNSDGESSNSSLSRTSEESKGIKVMHNFLFSLLHEPQGSFAKQPFANPLYLHLVLSSVNKDCTGFIPPAQIAGVLSGLFWVMRLSAFYEIWLHCQQHSSEEDEEYSDSQSLILAAIAYC